MEIQRIGTFSEVWNVMGPEVVLIIAGFALLVIDLFLDKEKRKIIPWLGIIALLVSAALVVGNIVKLQSLTDIPRLSGVIYVVDDYGNIFKLIFLLGSVLTLLLSIHYMEKVAMPRGEYTYILLFATVGAMVMASSLDLITLFVGLELLSISSYILVGMNRGSAKSAEGAMKYLVIGSIGTALTLYGMSFVYGITGSTNLPMAIEPISSLWPHFKFLLLTALVLMTAGFGIKISMSPFHMWTPDTYEGAPTPITAFLSAVSKAAGFAMMFRVLLYLFSGNISEWYMIFVVLAALTMAVGNIAALTQKNIKRLMAFSSIAQAGYLLVPLAVLGRAQNDGTILFQSVSVMVFYLAAYVLMTMGAFAIISLVTSDAGSEGIDSFKGLFQRSPFLAVAMCIFLLSMAGMPVTAGFFGKFIIILGAIRNGFFWLTAIMFAASVISFYYYFGIMRLMFAKDAAGFVQPSAIHRADAVEQTAASTERNDTAGRSDAGERSDAAEQSASAHHTVNRLKVPATLSVVVAVALIVTLGLGVMPNLLLNVLGKLAWFGRM